MKTLVGILLLVIVALSATVYMQHRTNTALGAQISKLEDDVADVPSLRAAKATLIKQLSEANTKFGGADLERQFREEGEARWERVIMPLYTPAIIRRLKPVPLPDGTRRVVYPNPYDLPYLLNEYCAARR